ncbi:hypothetical protein GZ998_10680 [Actinomyces sp. 594]|uniref:hypothetical protein n=1 Tax=Actinomyces sp. 594 TaxID=2057793 RepID=UPI001C56D153|nr:hypothetical protein [Actinomyces sp. 594]MBW3069961.1 hypothetical protein [Actinomyces sp. 594]
MVDSPDDVATASSPSPPAPVEQDASTTPTAIAAEPVSTSRRRNITATTPKQDL